MLEYKHGGLAQVIYVELTKWEPDPQQVILEVETTSLIKSTDERWHHMTIGEW